MTDYGPPIANLTPPPPSLSTIDFQLLRSPLPVTLRLFLHFQARLSQFRLLQEPTDVSDYHTSGLYGLGCVTLTLCCCYDTKVLQL